MTDLELQECPYCGNEKIGIIQYRRQGIPSGDNGWCAEIKCQCGARMKVWALKREWAEKTIQLKWNRRVSIPPKPSPNIEESITNAILAAQRYRAIVSDYSESAKQLKLQLWKEYKDALANLDTVLEDKTKQDERG